MQIFSDKNLAQKLERTEAKANADFVEARARLQPESGAEWIEVGGAFALFDGAESPLTQTFGLGMFDEIEAAEMDEIEAFFKKHNAPVFHEISPLAQGSIIQLLNERNYQPIELSSVLYKPVDEKIALDEAVNSEIKTRICEKTETDLWARTSAGGWQTEMPELGEFMFGLGQISANCQGAFPFLGEIDGAAIAAGMLFIYDDIALLGGASTVPEARRKGAQNALLAARLKFAAEKNCTLAMMAALPGSQSQRNAEKNGFRIAYTRTKWHLKV